MKKSLFGGIIDKTAALGPVIEKYGWKEGARIGDHTGSKGGVRCAVIPIILGAALRLREKSLTDKSSYVLAAIALFVCTFTKVNKILVVLGGAVFGLLALAVKRGGRHR